MAINGTSFNPNEHITKLPRYTKDAYGNSIKVEDDYLEVKWRLVWFRSVYPQGTIETEELCVDLDREVTVERKKWNAEKRKNEAFMVTGKGYARYKAIVTTGEGGRATGTKSESAVDFPDFCEKAETGAIGRALAALGFGTQFTGDELEESHRIVDSPVKDSPVKQTEEKPQPVSSKPATDKQPQVQVASAPQKSERPQLTVVANTPATGSKPVVTSLEQNAEQTISEQQLRSIRKLSEYLNKPVPTGIEALSDADARTIIQQLTAEYKAARQRA